MCNVQDKNFLRTTLFARYQAKREREWSCICVLEVMYMCAKCFDCSSYDFLLDFRAAPTVQYLFSFYTIIMGVLCVLYFIKCFYIMFTNRRP